MQEPKSVMRDIDLVLEFSDSHIRAVTPESTAMEFTIAAQRLALYLRELYKVTDGLDVDEETIDILQHMRQG